MKITREKIGNAEIRMWSGGSGPPLLYLHGFEQHPGAAPFLERLSEKFEVRAPESPGYGQSTGLDEMHDLLDMTLHHRALVEAWARGPVNVIGHSLGGMFAAELAVIAPHLVRRMVLVSPYGLWLDDEPLPDPFVLSPDALAKAKWHEPANAAREPSAYDEASDGPRHTFRTINLSAATKFLWPLPDRGYARRARYIRTPTLIVRGESDGLVSSTYCEKYPGTSQRSVVTIANAGHLPMVEQEDAFVAAVQSFLLQP
jgi:pimeloyl-ACP methyl ester carboxylesterase